jgi:DNA mismatch repair protein MSH4
MDDVRVLLRDCTPRSLAMVDELGKGTSARDGAALGGALLEALDAVPLTCIFATHLVSWCVETI